MRRISPCWCSRSALLWKARSYCIFLAEAKELGELRWIDRALADGEARIKKRREIVVDLDLLDADPTRAKRVLDAMLSALVERERYRESCLPNQTTSWERQNKSSKGPASTPSISRRKLSGAWRRREDAATTQFDDPRRADETGLHVIRKPLEPGIGSIAVRWCFGSSARAGHNARPTSSWHWRA